MLRRAERSYAREVDGARLIAAAMKTIEPLEPYSGEPAEVCTNAMNAALASLDPHSRYALTCALQFLASGEIDSFVVATAADESSAKR